MNVKYFNLISTNISTYELSYKQNRHDKNEGHNRYEYGWPFNEDN